ncbi:hypothetical protein, conserved [Leishmania tarentolae]|uniref:Uncharacterized protein n=1 Tax=Leishmania tarentolae TaxID=5689 RepID=A0A640KSU0_LEITA|nr:hypothetical protein, conserved [Leishmania tarentolae]
MENEVARLGACLSTHAVVKGPLLPLERHQLLHCVVDVAIHFLPKLFLAPVVILKGPELPSDPLWNLVLVGQYGRCVTVHKLLMVHVWVRVNTLLQAQTHAFCLGSSTLVLQHILLHVRIKNEGKSRHQCAGHEGVDPRRLCLHATNNPLEWVRDGAEDKVAAVAKAAHVIHCDRRRPHLQALIRERHLIRVHVILVPERKRREQGKKPTAVCTLRHAGINDKHTNKKKRAMEPVNQHPPEQQYEGSGKKNNATTRAGASFR